MAPDKTWLDKLAEHDDVNLDPPGQGHFTPPSRADDPTLEAGQFLTNNSNLDIVLAVRNTDSDGKSRWVYLDRDGNAHRD